MSSPHHDKKLREQIIAALRLADAKEQRIENNKLDLYIPHDRGIDGGQIAFHKSDAKIRLLITGNRYGKSTAANVMEPVWLATGTHPYHPILVPNRGKIYADSYGAVMENLYVKFQEWIPQRMLRKSRPYEMNNQGLLTGIHFANGSFIKIGSYDQEVRKAEGSNWHYVGYDEPPPRALYVANMRGLVDFGGRTWIAATPLSEAWIYDDLWMPGMSGEKPYIHCFRGTPEDNPHIDKKQLELFLEELTPEEKEIRFYGHFAKLKGLVIDTYDPLKSDIDPFPLNRDYVIYEGIDPHSNKPHTALWKAVRKDGRRFVVAELSCAGSIREFGEQIADMRKRLTDNGKNGSMLLRSVNDTSLNQTDGAFRINLRNELCDALKMKGENILPHNAQKKDWLLPGIAKLRDLFRTIQQSDGTFSPMQYVFKNCQRYKYELLHYQWPDGIQKDDVKPIAKHNDFIDPDRYIESLAPAFETPGTSRFLKVGNNQAYSRKGDEWQKSL